MNHHGWMKLTRSKEKIAQGEQKDAGKMGEHGNDRDK